MSMPHSSPMKGTLNKVLGFFRFGDLEMRKKIIIVQGLLLLLPLVILYYFLTGFYVKNRETELLSSNYQVSQIAMSNIDNYIQQIQELTKQPLYDSKVLLALVKSNEAAEASQTGQKAGEGYMPHSIAETDNSISNMANRILLFNKYINSVIVVDMNGNYVYRIIDNSLTKPYNALQEGWYQDCLRLDGKALLIRTFNFMDYILGDYYQNKKQLYVFSVARMIKETNANRKIGMIMININTDYLANICANVKSVAGERVLVLDEKNNICYDTEEKNITLTPGDPQFDIPALAGLSLKKERNSIAIGKSNYIVTSVVSEASGWKLVRIMPEAQLYSSVWDLRAVVTAILLSFVIISLLLSISISYSITKPLNKLMQTIKLINQGDFSLRFKVKHNDEVGQLGRRFNDMMDMIDNLVNTVHVTQIREREAELHALQAQINPHFIYNTLESIRLEARSNGNGPTADMVYALGKLLRYSINIKYKVVTVRDELDHLKNYLYLLNYRFDNKFSMVVDVEESLYGMKVIKLIFQPIVENSIYHGLETKDEDGIVRLTGRRTDGATVFDIEDNGRGMTGEQVEQLNERINDFTSFDQTEGSIGLKNINERIKLQYGNTCGITVRSEPGVGTTVRITLPEDTDTK